MVCTFNAQPASDQRYIAEDNPVAAARVIRAILDAAENLLEFAMLGHMGERAGTRELVLTQYPYSIIYSLTAHKVFVVSVLHQSRKHRA